MLIKYIAFAYKKCTEESMSQKSNQSSTTDFLKISHMLVYLNGLGL